VVVPLDTLGPRAGIAALIALLFDPESKVRPVFVARDANVGDLLAAAIMPLRHVQVPPVAAWSVDVPTLINGILADDLRSTHTLTELAPARVAALREYTWPNNRAEVRKTAIRVHALLGEGGNMAAAARAIGENYEVYRRALIRVGVVDGDARVG
jgi:hypothetical protein